MCSFEYDVRNAVRLYHFVNREFGLANLTKRRLKIARWNDLNDPFELAGAIFADKDLRKEMRRIKDEIHAAMGMLCFSKNWRNPVQWSHYADNHRGIGLGFDVQDDILQEVDYVPKRIECTLEEIQASSDKETHENLIHVMMATKYIDWHYEQEVRVFSMLKNEDNGLFFQKFDQDVELREVIVGTSAQVSRADIAQALGAHAEGVDVCKARLGFNKFEIVRNKDESLWK